MPIALWQPENLEDPCAIHYSHFRLSQLLRSEGGRPEQQEDLGFGAVHDGREGGARLQRSAGGRGRSSNVEELNCGSAEIGCHRAKELGHGHGQ